MPSIRQNAYPDLLPDFRNLAVMARVLLGVNALALAGAFYASAALGPALDRFIRAAAFLEPLLLIELMALVAASPWLALIRRDPKRAERTLEDLADLFRTLMADMRQFVRLADEIALLERYAEIEQLRLGERLRVSWELDAAPSDALLPPMVLQPLLEN